MRTKRWLTGAAVAAIALAMAAAPDAIAHGKHQHEAQQAMHQGTGGSGQAVQAKTLTPDQLSWGQPPPGLPQGAQAAVLSGNPGAKGEFVVRLKAQQDNYVVRPHTHPTDEYVTVIQGTFHAGMGTQFDKSKGEEFPAGSLIVMPADHPHFAWFDKDTVVQIQGQGPFQIRYVNPADDPRNQGVGGAGQSGQQSRQPDQSTQQPSGQQ